MPDLGPFEGKWLDDHSFEVEVEKSQSINSLFARLSEQGVEIVSMRNRANRLEELFVSMVGANQGARPDAEVSA